MIETWMVAPAILLGVAVGMLATRRRPSSSKSPATPVDIDAFQSPVDLGVKELANAPGWLLACLESVDHIALQICDTTHSLIGRSAAVILRDPVMHTAAIAAVSPGVDKRLINATISPESPAGRACLGGDLVVSSASENILGSAPTMRRRDVRGVAIPLRAGERGVGALVVFGPPGSFDDDRRAKVVSLAREAGPLLDKALQRQTQIIRETMDAALGISNERGLAQAIQTRAYPPCTLLRLEVDPLDAIEAQFGKPAAHGARRHVARIFERCLREDDVAAFLRGTSFAILLLECPQAGGDAVAKRLNQTLVDTPFRWDQLDLQLTCGVGVASVPDTVRRIDQLQSAAEEALRARA